MSEVQTKGKAAKVASFLLTNITTSDKNEALKYIAEQLLQDEASILLANKQDLEAGKAAGLTDAVLDRIMLNNDRIVAMHDAIFELIDLTDPTGEVLETIEKENGILIEKRRVPIGVVGMIYEARPNVTIDAATLALKTGNAIILRGSSSAKFSNMALVTSVHKALSKSKVPVDAVQLIEDTSRETAKELFRLNDYLDVLIPRGGSKLIETVVRESTVPVIETGAGNCHIFIDQTAKYTMAEQIILNAKLQRPSVCNAVETILVDADWFSENGIVLLNKLVAENVVIYGDKEVCKVLPAAIAATEDSWYEEYLDLALSVKLVHSIDEAIMHINKYGTRHSEAIISENNAHAALFLQSVDASSVYHNVSTRFTDGFEFGYGAEIGISTQKLHARGPMGLTALTSTKFFIRGNGQVRV